MLRSVCCYIEYAVTLSVLLHSMCRYRVCVVTECSYIVFCHIESACFLLLLIYFIYNTISRKNVIKKEALERNHTGVIFLCP